MTMSPLDTALLPETAPFNPEQRAWLNGFLAGMNAAGKLAGPGPAAGTTLAAPRPSLLLLFGSQTGTAEALAQRLAREATKRGVEAKAKDVSGYADLDLKGVSNLAIVTSTYGDGEMPDAALPFWDFIKGETAPRLEGLRFAVLGLGDTNYPQFCQAAKDFDRRLEELGAHRIVERIDCDVDYEAPALAWFEKLMGETLSQSDAAAPLALIDAAAPEVKAPAGFSKTNPFPARLKTNRRLNSDQSSKDTRHIEIVLEGSNLEYQVGDALGVAPQNCVEFAREIIASAGLTEDELVTTPKGGKEQLLKALVESFDLKPYLAELPAAGVSAADLTVNLKKLQPRLYSISSSPKAHPGEVHLTVGIVRYELNGRARKGVCSTFLSDRVEGEMPVPVFVHASPGFKPPKDLATPMIMVGPGTGIAPFRAFLEERRATGAPGANWLFFGDQRAEHDFLYRDELEGMAKDGFLTRLDTAFSRDQAEKIYVQNRMTGQAAELWKWLQEGAHFYVCGDASRMAKDVDAALHQVCQTAGGLSADGAAEYVKKMKTDKRYCRDVY